MAAEKYTLIKFGDKDDKWFSLLTNGNFDTVLYSLDNKNNIENLEFYLNEMVVKSHKFALTLLNGKEDSNEITKGQVEASVKRLLNEWIIKDKSITFGVLLIATDILHSLLTAPKFNNGNIRTSIITTILFLQSVGLNVKTGIKDDLWIKFIYHFFKNLKLGTFVSINEEKRFIANFLFGNIIVNNENILKINSDQNILNIENLDVYLESINNNKSLLASLIKIGNEN